MKSIKTNILLAATTIAFGFLVSESNAQYDWRRDYSPSCSERGGCQHGNQSIELIPYGQNYPNPYRRNSAATPYRDSFRAPYQSSLGNYTGGCGYGGTCSRSHQSQTEQHFHGASNFNLVDRCPYEQRQFEKASYDPRSMYGGRTPYGGGYESDPSFNPRPSYSAPSRRSLESYQQAPADRRPELRPTPSFAPSTSYGRNDSAPQLNELTVPPTSTQIMPPPELPPQPSASKSRQSMPQLLPPTTVPGTQQSTHDHAGHDHSGHDHSGHYH